MSGHNISSRIGRNVFVTLLLSLGLLLAGLLIMAMRQNEEARRYQVRMVEGGLSQFTEQQRTTVRDFAIWTDLYNAVSNRDSRWLEGNLGASVTETKTTDFIIILDAAQQPIFAWHNDWGSTSTPGKVPASFLSNMTTLLKATAKDSSTASSAYVNFGETVALATAMPIQPTDGSVHDQNARPMLVMGYALDPNRVGKIGASFLLEDFKLLPADAEGLVAVNGLDGTLGSLSWHVAQPGTDTLMNAMVPLLLLVLAGLTVAAYLAREAGRMTNQISWLNVELGEKVQTLEQAQSELIDKTQVEEQRLQEIIAAQAATQNARADAQLAEQKTALQERELIAVLSEALDELSRGRLSARIKEEDDDQFRQIKVNVNLLAQKLQAVGGQASVASHKIQSVTSSIAEGVADLSTRTEHQASSIEQTAASMKVLSATVKHNADNAQSAKELAAEAHTLALKGGDIAGLAISAMSRIEESSRQIGEITGLIADIAFQTNILALNAAVEAARAGDAGKGFAVVASEVRTLAQRAAAASKDIKGLTSHSDQQVRVGADLVAQAGAALREIVSAAKDVVKLNSEIALATTEQATGIDQVSRAVSTMDHVTHQNAALVEETNSALKSAQIQVEELERVVSFFRCEETSDPQSTIVELRKAS